MPRLGDRWRGGGVSGRRWGMNGKSGLHAVTSDTNPCVSQKGVWAGQTQGSRRGSYGMPTAGRLAENRGVGEGWRAQRLAGGEAERRGSKLVIFAARRRWFALGRGNSVKTTATAVSADPCRRCEAAKDLRWQRPRPSPRSRLRRSLQRHPPQSLLTPVGAAKLRKTFAGKGPGQSHGRGCAARYEGCHRGVC